MRERIKVWLVAIAVAVGLALLAWSVPASAATWTVITNDECTGVGAATSTTSDTSAQTYCCTGLDVGFCNRRDSGGTLFTYHVTLVADGTYTANGDAVTAAQLAKIPLDTITDFACDLATNGAANAVPAFANVKRTDTRKGSTIVLHTVTAGALAQVTGAIDGFTLQCIVAGY